MKRLMHLQEHHQGHQARSIHDVVCHSPTKVLVAQDLLAGGEQALDLSGNPILKDVGLWMRNEFKAHFKEADIKYIDPSYMIRSTPTISADRIYCKARAFPNPMRALHTCHCQLLGADFQPVLSSLCRNQTHNQLGCAIQWAQGCAIEWAQGCAIEWAHAVHQGL